MKSLILAALVVVTGAAPALAADQPARKLIKAPSASDPAYNWGGWYVGVNAGGNWGRSDVANTFNTGTSAIPLPNQPATPTAGSTSLTPNGFTAGAQLVYNHQVDRWLFGVEADAGFFGARQTRKIDTPFPITVSSFTTSNAVSTDWLFTLRPRVGYAVDRTLFYATGGLALTELKYNGGFSDGLIQAEAAGFTKTKAGWAAGLGIEHAFTKNWTAKVEYLYTDFGKQSVVSPLSLGQSPAAGSVTNDVDLKAHTLRGGLNYHFGGPSVARY